LVAKILNVAHFKFPNRNLLKIKKKNVRYGIVFLYKYIFLIIHWSQGLRWKVNNKKKRSQLFDGEGFFHLSTKFIRFCLLLVAGSAPQMQPDVGPQPDAPQGDPPRKPPLPVPTGMVLTHFYE